MKAVGNVSDVEIFYCILGMCVVSYIPRALPPFVLARRKLSPVVERWLKYVPTSVFGALVFSEIFISGDTLNLSLGNVNLLVSLLVFAVAVKTKSLGKCIGVGLAAYWLAVHYF